MVKRGLESVDFDKGLKLVDGTYVHSLEELLSALKLLSNEEFNAQLKKDKHIITSWILQNYEELNLIAKLKNSDTRQNYVDALEQRIRDLKKNNELYNLINERDNLKSKKLSMIGNIWIIMSVLLLSLIIFQHFYYDYSSKSIQDQNDELMANLIFLSNQNNELEVKILGYEYLIRDSELELGELSLLNENLLNQLAQNSQIKGPKERIFERDLAVYRNQVLINMNGPFFANFEDTGSMEPLLNSNSKAIQIKPLNENELEVGDIISFNVSNQLIIHRIVEIGEDELGWFVITKGDNNLRPDPFKVRFNQIDRVLVAIIY
jgi:hypothetical protein